MPDDVSENEASKQGDIIGRTTEFDMLHRSDLTIDGFGIPGFCYVSLYPAGSILEEGGGKILLTNSILTLLEMLANSTN